LRAEFHYIIKYEDATDIVLTICQIHFEICRTENKCLIDIQAEYTICGWWHSRQDTIYLPQRDGRLSC